jgi:hypothetical protein
MTVSKSFGEIWDRSCSTCLPEAYKVRPALFGNLQDYFLPQINPVACDIVNQVRLSAVGYHQVCEAHKVSVCAEKSRNINGEGPVGSAFEAEQYLGLRKPSG